MADWVEISRGIVLPQQCDHYGHMNVRFYAHVFDDAGFHMLNLAGIKMEDLAARGFGTVIAKISIDFLHEIKAGQLTLVTGAITRVGTKSFDHELRLFEADSMTHCATQRSVEVCFDTTARKAVALPNDLKAKLTAMVVPAKN